MTDHARIRIVRSSRPFRAADLVVAALLIALAVLAAVWPGRDAGETVRITADGVTRVYALARDQTIAVKGLTVVIEDGTVRVAAADCPDKTCTKGTAKRAGDMLVCLPSNVVIQITGRPEVDISTG